MKKMLLTFLMIAMVLSWVQAQQPVFTIHGRVTYQETGLPVAGQSVIIYIDSLQNSGHSNKVVTDLNGEYADTMLYLQGIDQQAIHVYTFDCQGDLVSGTGYFRTGKREEVINLRICGNADTRCEANFKYAVNPLNASEIAFYDGSRFLPGSGKMSYNWHFGDSTSSNEPNPVHKYREPGFYQVCLSISSGDSLCNSIFCLPLQVGNMHTDSCYTNFWYQADSAGAYQFSAITTTNLPATFNWDFGDGTKGTGPKVTHHFQGNGSQYNVCLMATQTLADGTTCTSANCQAVQVYTPENCSNHFVYQTGNNVTFTFTAYTDNGTEATQYIWDFGDGDTATGKQVTHTFRVADAFLKFNVCLTTVISVPAATGFYECKYMSCQAVYTGLNTNCKAEMTAAADSSGFQFQFKNISKGMLTSQAWDFGDGTQSPEANPTHNYTKPGLYTVCLSIGDSLNTCNDKTCQEIWVHNAETECKASFNFLPADSAADNSFQFINTSSPAAVNQFWSFGDNTFAYDKNPVHSYAAAGVYNVCLTSWDNNGNCKDVHCSEIVAGIRTGDNQVYGVVMAGNHAADQGIVWLISPGASFYDQTRIDSAGTYHFDHVPAGSYYIYAMLSPASADFFNYMPTYYKSALTWKDASLIYTLGPSFINVVNLVPVFKDPGPQGTSVISGNINWNNPAGTQDVNPASNVIIVLYNDAGAAVASTMTNDNGYFEFDRLQTGKYSVYAEMAGKENGSAAITLDDANAHAIVNFMMSPEAILLLGIDQAKPSMPNAGNPYPNPVGSMLYLDLDAKNTEVVEIEILDIQGRMIKSEKANLTGSSNRMGISTGSLPKGAYLLRLNFQNQKTVWKKFVK